MVYHNCLPPFFSYTISYTVENMEQENRKLHSLELRVPIAEDYVKFLTNVENYTKELPSWTNNKRLSFTMAVLNKLSNIQIPIGMKPYAVKLENEFQSARDALSDGTVSVDELSFSAVIENKAVAEKLVDSLKERIKSIHEGTCDDAYVNEQAKAARRALNSVFDEMQKLGCAEDKAFSICRAPVIPVPNSSYFIMERLGQTFRLSSIGGYPILHDQVVVGINRSIVGNGKVESTLQDVIKKLESKKGIHYIRIVKHGVSSPIAGKNITWYWLMPEGEADAFRLCFRNFGKAGVVGSKTLGLQGISLRTWGFANGT